MTTIWIVLLIELVAAVAVASVAAAWAQRHWTQRHWAQRRWEPAGDASVPPTGELTAVRKARDL